MEVFDFGSISLRAERAKTSISVSEEKFYPELLPFTDVGVRFTNDCIFGVHDKRVNRISVFEEIFLLFSIGYYYAVEVFFMMCFLF